MNKVKFTPRMPESNVNVTPTSPLKDFFVLLSAAIGILVGIYFLLGLAVDFFAPRIPPEIEQNMASAFISSIAVSEKLSNKTQEVQNLLDALQKQCAKLPYEFNVHLHDSPQVNAVALPGGNIVVFSGLLDQVKSETELSFVLSHEMGHYAHRDHLRALGRALIFMALSAALFGPDSSVGELLAQSLNITELGFSRKQETHADEYALDILYCRYRHVDGAIGLIKKLTADEDTGLLGHYFSTHPQSRERISHVKTYSRSKKYPINPPSESPPEA
ncbi:MAG: M48 family metallopeptidase [Deltaproteobacteria bacterium]|nr:M48 family metallopeptidase [Deltaproteobacteria bacterium]